MRQSGIYYLEVLAAVDELKDEDWMKECRIWMYRGAWAEWEIDHIEMAVPISPEELRYKCRIAIAAVRHLLFRGCCQRIGLYSTKASMAS